VICIRHGSLSLMLSYVLANESLLNIVISYVSFLVIVILYCANRTAFHIHDWKVLEGGR